MPTAVERERERCLRIIAASREYARSIDKGRKSKAPGAAHLLLRIANQIRGGEEPVSFEEQMLPPRKRKG